MPRCLPPCLPRFLIAVLWSSFFAPTAAVAQVSIGIDLPGVSIGIEQPVFPELVRVPGYPVYYAPRLNSNYFFYDGMYWVYERDNWYASAWYNGPWSLVDPDAVPLYVLRIPVRYYRSPPQYFRGWRADAPPRWEQHWGNAWAQQRSGWDQWNRRAAPAPAPLPVYQRQYAGNRYPRVEQQQALQGQNYRYRPRDSTAHPPPVRTAPAPSQRGQALPEGISGPHGEDGRRAMEVKNQQVQRQQQARQEQQAQRQQQDAAQREQQIQRQQQGAAQREQQVQRQQQDAAQREQQQIQRQQRGAAQHEQQVQRQQHDAAQHEQQVQRPQQSAPQPGQARPNPQNGRENKGAPQEAAPERGRGQEREKGGERGQERDR